MYDILFENATVLAPDFSGVLRNRVVGITGDKITLVRPMADWHADIEAAERIDATDMLVMPGLVDCHMHTGQQLLRGRVLDSLPMVWTRIMLPFESTLTPELMTLSAELAALELYEAVVVAAELAVNVRGKAVSELFPDKAESGFSHQQIASL